MAKVKILGNKSSNKLVAGTIPIYYWKDGTKLRLTDKSVVPMSAIILGIYENIDHIPQSIIDEVFAYNEENIIFTQYREMGELLTEMIKNELRENALFFHGGVSRTNRDRIVEDFQTTDAHRLMVITLKAGGIGLNLTAATNVIHYDLWWNPAVEAQATDRTYRIGQERNVIVHRLITIGTFEERIDEMIKAKKELANLTVVAGEKWIAEFSDKELKEIFSL